MEAHLHVTSVLTCNSEGRTRPSWVNLCWAALQPDRPGWFYCPVVGVPLREVSEASHVSRSISISISPIWLWPQPANGALRPTRCFWFCSVDGSWPIRSSRWTAMLAGWLANTLSDWTDTKSTLFTPILVDKDKLLPEINTIHTEIIGLDIEKVAGRLDLLCSFLYDCFLKSKLFFCLFVILCSDSRHRRIPQHNQTFLVNVSSCLHVDHLNQA